MSAEIVLKLEEITKVFPGVKALDKVGFELQRGEVHALCGENGAGKSTLMKIISGAQTCTSGKITFEGRAIHYRSTEEAQKHGIAMIYQEFNLIPNLTVGENIFIGRQPTRNGVIDWKKMADDARLILAKVGLEIDPNKRITQLSVAESQMVEIAKCLSMDSKVIIMDEPTAALTDEEIRCLFTIINNLKTQGISIVYISHRLEEIFKICDRATILRDGKYICTTRIENTNCDELISLMIGRELSNLYPARAVKSGEVILTVQGMSYRNVFKDVGLSLHTGEILGIAGLIGSGNIQLAKAIAGTYDGNYDGEIVVAGTPVKFKKPMDAIRAGISMVPDDRKNEGLVLVRDVRENISLASLDDILEHFLIKPEKEQRKAGKQISSLGIKVSSDRQLSGNLSGGNQQKVVLAKMLETHPKILILLEPTRGIDIGAKAEIYKLMNSLTESGIGIILVSSDLPELIGMSDRVLVMKSGKLVKQLEKCELSQEVVLAYAAGGVQ